MQDSGASSAAVTPRGAGRRWRAPGAGVVTTLAGGAVLLALHARNALDSDEGVILNGAWNLLHGRALYTDFFEFLPPGSFYAVLAAWKVFGSSYWVAKALGLAALALAAFGIDRIARLLVAQRGLGVAPHALTAAPLLFCLFSGYLPTINHNTFHLPVAVWSAFFAIRGIQAASWRGCALAGLLCGGSAWFLQHRAALMAVATLAVLLLHACRRPGANWRWCCAAYVLGVAAPVGAMAVLWAPPVLFDHLIVFPATRYLEVNRVDRTLIACAATFALGAAWLLRRTLDAPAAMLLALLGALLLTALQRPDLGHVTSALWPLLCLLPRLAAVAATTWLARLGRTWIAMGMAALPLPLVAMVFANPTLYFSDWSRRHPALQYVRQHCEQAGALYAGPFAPGLYYETGMLNPTRYSVLLPKFNTDAQFRDALRDLQLRRPRCAITNHRLADKFGSTRDTVVDAYLAANYDVVFEARNRQVWMARAPRPIPPVAPTPAAPVANP